MAEQTTRCVIRQASAQDTDALAELHAELAGLHREQLPDRFQLPPSPAGEREFLLGRLAEANVRFWVAEAGQALCGYAQASMLDTPPIPSLRPRHYGYINEIFVRAEYRQQGIGRQLMAAAEAWARAQGAASIELGMYEFNTEAREFYDRLGYTTLHRRLSKPLPASTASE